MIFQYYFDTDRTHTIRMGFEVSRIETLEDGSLKPYFEAYVEEQKGEVLLARENIFSSFTIPASEGETSASDDYDLDFKRIRYNEQNKWIYHITNSKMPSEEIIIGLITETANKNPEGLEIIHESDSYEAEVKANNLAKLEQSYVPPQISQTVAYAKFDTVGFPPGFKSMTSSYDSMFKLIVAKEFYQEFRMAIPTKAKFDIELNVAPETFNVENLPDIFTLSIENLGIFKLQEKGIYWRTEGYPDHAIVTEPIDPALLPLEPITYFNNGFTPSSKLTITGDGKGNLTATYSGATIQARYDEFAAFPSMTFKGAQANIY